jgi:hypothetical protein
MRSFKTARFVFVLCLALAGNVPARADSVYQWTDPDGTVHFGSKPLTKDAKPAELPKITKEHFNPAKGKLVSCSAHGGIDCQAGPDVDGSVICRDGFKDASPRFTFSCSSPQLALSDVSPVRPEGTFSVFVRNGSSVEAKKPVVTVRSPDGQAKLVLPGPDHIDPYGMAEFAYTEKRSEPLFKEKPSQGSISVSCANCS